MTLFELGGCRLPNATTKSSNVAHLLSQRYNKKNIEIEENTG